MDDVKQKLAELSGKTLAVICVGNPMRGDDGFGPAVAARLSSGSVFDAGSVPENVLPKVARLGPEVVVFVDAAAFGAEPGTMRLIAEAELAQGDFSTHAAPLSMSMDYLRQACGARSVLLAAQPKRTELGSVMSVELARAAETAARLLQDILG